MATRRTTKTGLVVDAENNAPSRITKTGVIIATAPLFRRTTKTGIIVDAENAAPVRTTKLGIIVATAPEVESASGLWPRFFSLILTFFLGG